MKKLLRTFLSALACGTLAVSAISLSACGKDDKTITIAASPTPHAEILKDVVKPLLEKEGYTLDVREYNDYVVPNTVVESGQADANYFQHNLYLNGFNADNGTHLVAVAQVHYEPFGIYRGSYTAGALADLPAGSQILVPNDGTNEARALFLLQQEGLITLKEGIDATKATKLDVAENPKNYEIVELEAAQIPRSLHNAGVGVINGNYALGAELKIEDAVATENATDGTVAQYVNVIAVKEGSEDTPKIQALVKAILSDEVKAYIAEKYNGAVVAVF